ncbi:hypothetical protein [Gaiella occulta]|uniref:hypothetical protein n=1 Tax=Gaiella occulta TaxID=1002870 RepID=UPI000E0B01AC|nr:hypothetical protein [Gaiella occulta]
MLAIEAEQHPLRATGLDLLREQALVDATAVVARVEALCEILGELVELHGGPLHAALLRRQQVTGRDAVRPRAERRVAPERRKAGDELDEDLLARLLREPDRTQRELLGIHHEGRDVVARRRDRDRQGMGVHCRSSSPLEELLACLDTREPWIVTAALARARRVAYTNTLMVV